MNPLLPAFGNDDVALLISAVEETLKNLRDANEKIGGNDVELLEYGRKYALILQKLKAVMS